MATTELVSVEFHGDTILATKATAGIILVAVKRICESIGVDFSGQLQKLKKTAWAGMEIISTPDSNGAEQQTWMIPVDRLPMWMATITVNKIKAELRPKLIAYQLEAAGVLAHHFLPPATTTTPAQSPAVMPGHETFDEQFAKLDILAGMLDRVRSVIAVQAEQERHLLAVEHKADAALSASAGDTGFMSLLGYCRLHQIRADRKELAQIGYTLKKVCTAWGLKVRTAPHEVYGKVNLYPIEVLERWASSRP